MLKQLVEDVKFEVCRREYLEKVTKLGQKDIQLALLGYPLISPKKIENFLYKNWQELSECKKQLLQWTIDESKYHKSIKIKVECKEHWHDLSLKEVPLENYDKYIPESCLDKLMIAKDSGLFDYFTVAYPRHQLINKSDPVIFGRRDNSVNRFFIAQWDNDVTLDDLL